MRLNEDLICLWDRFFWEFEMRQELEVEDQPKDPSRILPVLLGYSMQIRFSCC